MICSVCSVSYQASPGGRKWLKQPHVNLNQAVCSEVYRNMPKRGNSGISLSIRQGDKDYRESAFQQNESIINSHQNIS
jgi:hypothetical protein